MNYPRFLTDGSIEALKWLALVLMTGDHINKYLFNGTMPVLSEIGRLAMPIFVFVLVYNLSRPGALSKGVYYRTMKRLALFALLATPVIIALGSGWLPLNILFTLLVITVLMYLIELNSIASYTAAIAIFLLGGSLVEFWWPALTYALAVRWHCKRPNYFTLALTAIALATLWYVNGNFWALLALPVVSLASHAGFSFPRLRWVFYTYYPLHLALLWLIRIPMRQAGYLFF
jgi:hypothetical protein